ncbi:MAG TPA: ArsC/Spx/MgsR family protein, partial [Polyangiaceae bacterium]|nr:ArsC/Spx/MgsR family protein [Polyangiaceae bacterium]
GHTLEVRDLLSWPWDEASLSIFLTPLPVPEWFNRAAPRVKSGDVVPERLERHEAIALLLAEPLLIRRPLMALPNGDRMVGFETDRVQAWIGLGGDVPTGRSLESCAAETMKSTRPR